MPKSAKTGIDVENENEAIAERWDVFGASGTQVHMWKISEFRVLARDLDSSEWRSKGEDGGADTPEAGDESW